MEIIASIDPVTRLEGHLKVVVTIDTVNGAQQVVDAQVSGRLFRGFEQLIVGRDPRDAQHITERICGVCPVAHGMTAVMALDNAFGITIPDNARVMRNLVNGSNFIDSHIMHFYLLCLPDFFEGPAMPPWTPNWGGDRRLTTQQNAALTTHYLKAIEMRRKAHEMGALFGGKIPHPPAYISGGFTTTPRPDRIAGFKAYLLELIPFITDIYIPDVELVAGKYPEYFTIGRGHGNLLSYGVFDLNAAGTSKLLAPGVSVNGSTVSQALDQAKITEHVTASWFGDSTHDQHPAVSTTDPLYPKPGAYSWVKAPRYNELPCEVGPLARMWANGDYRGGISVMDRHRARALEALKVAQAMAAWVDTLNPAGPVYVEAAPRPANATGFGLTEAPRGALGHWISINNSKTSHYEVISPTTWNASPRDGHGLPGPLEEAMLGTPVENADQPIEVLRVIHSFDPCLDCATHVLRPKAGAKIFAVPHLHGEMPHSHDHAPHAPDQEHDHGHDSHDRPQGSPGTRLGFWLALILCLFGVSRAHAAEGLSITFTTSVTGADYSPRTFTSSG